MAASECTRCQHRNVLNVGIGMLDTRNALEKCWHRNELKCRNWNVLKCRHRNAPNVGIHVRSEDCMSEQLVAKKNNLWQKTSRWVGTVLWSGWNILSEYFSCQDGTLCRNTFHVRMEHFVHHTLST